MSALETDLWRSLKVNFYWCSWTIHINGLLFILNATTYCNLSHFLDYKHHKGLTFDLTLQGHLMSLLTQSSRAHEIEICLSMAQLPVVQICFKFWLLALGHTPKSFLNFWKKKHVFNSNIMQITSTGKTYMEYLWPCSIPGHLWFFSKISQF